MLMKKLGSISGRGVRNWRSKTKRIVQARIISTEAGDQAAGCDCHNSRDAAKFRYALYSFAASIMARRFSDFPKSTWAPPARIKPPPGAHTSISFLQYSYTCVGSPVTISEDGTFPEMQHVLPTVALALAISVLSNTQATSPLANSSTVSSRVV